MRGCGSLGSDVEARYRSEDAAPVGMTGEGGKPGRDDVLLLRQAVPELGETESRTESEWLIARVGKRS